MKEQLPLKRIFIGFAASVTAGVAVTAAGTVNTAVLNLPEISSSYVLRSEAVWDDTYSTEASVVALNHEETNNNSSNITKLIDLTVSSSAFKAVMENQEEAGQPEQAETTEETAEETQEEYEVEEWWKAELSDYSETLEQQELIPTEIPVPEQPEAAEQPESEGSSANEPGIIQTPSVPAQSGTSVGAAEIRLPDTLTPNTVYFTSYGYGHGIGMSQNGANYYAKYGGYDYLQILEHYYPGTTIAYTPDAETETISVRGYSGSVVDIISMVCNAEIGSSFEVEAIKAQAVAAYTYVKHAGGSDRKSTRLNSSHRL